MHFIEDPVIDLPSTQAEWAALSAADKDTLYARWTPQAVVRVHDSPVLAELTGVQFQLVNGEKYLPLHVVEYIYARAMQPAAFGAGVREQSLRCVIAPAALGRVEAALVAHGLDTSKCSLSELVRRVDEYMEDVPSGLPAAALELGRDDLVPIQADAVGAQAARTWPYVHVTFGNCTGSTYGGGTLRTYAEFTGMLGPRVSRERVANVSTQVSVVGQALKTCVAEGALQVVAAHPEPLADLVIGFISQTAWSQEM